MNLDLTLLPSIRPIYTLQFWFLTQDKQLTNTTCCQLRDIWEQKSGRHQNASAVYQIHFQRLLSRGELWPERDTLQLPSRAFYITALKHRWILRFYLSDKNMW